MFKDKNFWKMLGWQIVDEIILAAVFWVIFDTIYSLLGATPLVWLSIVGITIISAAMITTSLWYKEKNKK